MRDILQLLQALVVYLIAMALLTITFPCWIRLFIKRLRVPFLPTSVID
jgi:hypothetical protein